MDKIIQHPLRCRCGVVQGFVENPQRANRVVCYCKDCQAFARFLGNEDRILDARGGSEIFQVLPKDVTFVQGVESLACLRLTEKGMVRWYAACCRTPIGNTLENFKVSFVGLLHNCLETVDRPLQDFFGPVRTYAYPNGAIGDPKPKASGMATTIWWFLKTISKARFNGDYKHTPFFRMDTGKPIAAPHVLSHDERSNAMRQPAR
ncbi:MAG TPA: DUF6151 family protein [Steroidobacteraceae bacterium]